MLIAVSPITLIICAPLLVKQSKSTWSYPTSLPSVGKIISVFKHKKMKMNLQDAPQLCLLVYKPH